MSMTEIPKPGQTTRSRSGDSTGAADHILLRRRRLARPEYRGAFLEIGAHGFALVAAEQESQL